jgi:hypothetical protein
MFTTIITDCKGENEAGRQIVRFASLGLGPTNLIGVGNGLDFDATVEAAGNLVDILDATQGKRGVIVVNIAPRGNKNDGENGSSFTYFYHNDTLVIASVIGNNLSLAVKLGLINNIKLLDIPEILEHAVFAGLITADMATYIKNSQFRSFDFIPRVALWLLQGTNLPSGNITIEQFSNIPSCIWHIDTFGNAKTTLLTEELKDVKTKKQFNTNLGLLNYYERLKDIPAGETAIYTGSSGIGNKRFIEIATQAVAGSAAKTLNLKVGDEIKLL